MKFHESDIREMCSYWTWIAAHANWVLFECGMTQKTDKWWRRYFSA